jgi:hypothetical protein
VAELASHHGWLENVDAVSGASGWWAALYSDMLCEHGFTHGLDTFLKLAGQYRIWQ